ncbi:MAG: Crp/Fnr family transcriptional regulator [Dehalococcoidia bacterium]|jgi:CRP/FNR family transcriptional regulator
MSKLADFLKSTPYFNNLSGKGELDRVGKYVFERKVEKGELVLAEGEQPQALYFVVAGAVKMFKTSPEGKEQIFLIVYSGSSFNDVAVFDGGRNPVSAQAMVASVLYGIRKSDIEIIIKENPNVAVNVSKVLAGKVRQLAGLVEDLSFKSVTGRVAKILIENSTDGNRERQRLTQQDMAAMAGTAREVVGRALKSLEDDGVIKMDRHRIVIKDIGILKGIAGANL